MGSRAKEEFDQFERRAALAEEQLQFLTKRIELLEKGLLPPSPNGTYPRAEKASPPHPHHSLTHAVCADTGIRRSLVLVLVVGSLPGKGAAPPSLPPSLPPLDEAA